VRPPVKKDSTPRPQPTCRSGDTLFKGETLRSILLNASGWWTVATIALFVGFLLIVAGVVLTILSVVGFRHARRSVIVVA
jgi:hypothetical protein